MPNPSSVALEYEDVFHKEDCEYCNPNPPCDCPECTQEEDLPISLYSLDAAWGIIINADKAWDNPQWREAAEKWRDEVYHPALDAACADFNGAVARDGLDEKDEDEGVIDPLTALLINNTDATVWADALIETFGGQKVERDLLVTWFSCAIMAGWDEGYQAGSRDASPKIEVTKKELYELAGTLSVPYLRANPDQVMPADEVADLVQDFFDERNF